MSKVKVNELEPLSGTSVSFVNGTDVSIAGDLSVAGNTSVTGSFTGSFFGDGSNLAGVTSYTDSDTLTFIQGYSGSYSGSFSGSFEGDGSSLTGIETFPYTGSATISGSLNVIGDLLQNGAAIETDPFPYTGSAQVLGSLKVSGSVGLSYGVNNPSVSGWSTGGALGTARYSLAGAGTQNAGLAFGGLASPANVGCTEEYDGTSWSAGGALITARRGLGGAGEQNAALAFGGNPGENITEEYNGTSWSSGGTLITGRENLGGAGTQNAGLAFGGSLFTFPFGASNGTEEYDGTAWSAGGALITAKFSLAGAGTQNEALAFGGVPSGTTTEEYDGTSWSAGGALITGRGNLAGVGTQNAALGFGGTVPSIVSCTEEYNGTSWSVGTGLSTARRNLGGAGIQASALAFGGATPANVACTEEYTITPSFTSYTKTFDYSDSTGEVSATGSFTGSFQGDGSNLTGIETFPYTGSAVISGSLTVDGAFVATSITETSARRFKDNILDLESAQPVYSLRPVTYTWKSSGGKDLGLIAEEVYEHLPELVEKDQAGEIKGLKYSKITSLLIKAVQEQQQQIHHLTQEINLLKNKS